MKNVDKKYTPPPAPICLPLFPYPPLSLSLLQSSCILLSTRWPRKGRRFAAICHVGPEVLPEMEKERQRERESNENMYVIAFVVVVREGAAGGRGWC